MKYVLKIYAAVFCRGCSFCLIKVHHAYSLNSVAVLIRIHVCLMLEKTYIRIHVCLMFEKICIDLLSYYLMRMLCPVLFDMHA
jgi:hypothetical protein